MFPSFFSFLIHTVLVLCQSHQGGLKSAAEGCSPMAVGSGGWREEGKVIKDIVLQHG